MVELARGNISDRPWGLTLGAISKRGVPCQLTVVADSGGEFQIAFDGDAITAAASPLVADSAIRIALTNHFITPSLTQAIARQLAQQPGLDEVDMICDLAHLNPEQAVRLRRRVIAQRAARTFAIDHGTFVVEDEITLPIRPFAVVDMRGVLYAGMRLLLSEDRLSLDVQELGSTFTLRPDAIDSLPQYGFTPAEKPILDALRTGTTLFEMEAMHRELDPRTVHAVIYALVACDECEATRRMSDPLVQRPLSAARADTDREAFDEMLAKTTLRKAPDDIVRDQTLDPPIRNTPRFADGTMPPPRPTPAPPPRPLVQPRMAPRFAPKSGQFAARLEPERISASESGNEFAANLEPERVEARITNLESATPTEPARPAELPRATKTDLSAEAKAALAQEAFRRGLLLLRENDIERAIQDLTTATELAPNDTDHHAMLAWAQFCGASSRAAVADRVRRTLAHAIQKSPNPELARFYLGRVERMLGRDREALAHFQAVLDQEPRNAEAQAEVRAIEARIASGSAEKPGLATLQKRKK